MVKTGWPPGLLQDDSRGLSRWFASRIDARWVLRNNLRDVMDERQSGRTTKQIKDAPQGAVYLVHCWQHVRYVASLARHCERRDLRIETLAWLRRNNWYGVRVPYVVDHEAQAHLTPHDRVALGEWGTVVAVLGST